MTFNKKSLAAIILFLAVSTYTLQSQSTNNSGINNQPDTADFPYWIKMMQDPDFNFFRTQNAFYKYFKNRPSGKGTGYKQFKRWEYRMERRIFPDGSIPQQDLIWNNFTEYQKSNRRSVKSGASWSELGPRVLINGGGYDGLGRINALGFHPTDPSVLFIGAPSGGLWRSDDGGVNWTTFTDNLPSLGISDIQINYNNPDIMYIGTGDRDGGDSYGYGVMKSYDAGINWVLSREGMGNVTVSKMVMHNSNPDIIIAATSKGIYKTTNAGTNWYLTTSENFFKDLKYKPGDMMVLYAAQQGDFFRSADGGETWTETGVAELPSDGRFVIGVSPANNNTVYVAVADGPFTGLYESLDSGLTFTEKSNSPNIMGYDKDGNDENSQAWYDFCIAVDPTNINNVIIGGINVWISYNAGTTWNIVGHWYGASGIPEVHADQHTFDYSPTDGKLYIGNDGGIYVTDNNGQSWSELSNGLGISQVYKIGQSATQKDKVINGYQDNGTMTYLGNSGISWVSTGGGDGMECAVDHTDPAYSYSTLYYGKISRWINNSNKRDIAAKNINGITESGAWVTPFCLHENNSNVMFIGYKNIWRSVNIKESDHSNVSWQKLCDNLAGSNTTNISVVEHSPANNNLFYFARSDKKLFRTENLMGIPVWDNFTANLPNNQTPTDLEAHPTDENIIYMTQSYKVYKSSDKGNSWVNISGSLPYLPINDIVYDPASNEGLYIATDAGVYFMDGPGSDWIFYGDGLPLNVSIEEIEIFHDPVSPENSRLRVGTYGRGLWEFPLSSNDTSIPANESDSMALVALYNSCGGANWNYKNNWLTGQVANWYGIHLDENGRVTHILLDNNNLSGNLPEELGTVSEIVEFKLYFNQLSGVLPGWISALTNLKKLDLSWNRLIGEIPSTWFSLTKLESLYLSYNQLNGDLPNWISDFTNLIELNLGGNQLTGEIPSSWSGLSNLEILNLGDNQLLSRALPIWISELTPLTELNLGINQFTGEIPSSWSALTNLRIFHLGGNQFLTGVLPDWISGLTNLRELELGVNQFTGEIPSSWSVLTKLELIALPYNQLSGILPDWISGWTNLKKLYLGVNQFTGEIPSSWSSLAQLEVLSLYNNQISGVLPEWISGLTILKELTILGNQFTGEIPSDWSALINLEHLWLSDNQLIGIIPDWISSFTKLRGLRINSNSFTEFPDLSGLYHISDLTIYDNLFDFGDIEPNMGISNFLYSPQRTIIGTPQEIILSAGEEFATEVQIGGEHNIYQWYKDDEIINSANSTTLTILTVVPNDAGTYTCLITNSIIQDLSFESEPVQLSVTHENNTIYKPLSQGWTWFSLNVSDGSMDINEVLGSLSPHENDYIKNHTVSAIYYEDTGWFGNLEQLNNTEMYKINLDQADILVFTGLPVDPAQTAINTVTGWNWIGYTPQENILLGDALFSLNIYPGDYIKDQTISATYYDGSGWFGFLTQLEPLDGYMLKVAESGILTYPGPGLQPKSLNAQNEKPELLSKKDYSPNEFEFNGSVTAEVFINGNNSSSKENILYAFVGNDCRGKAKGKLFPPNRKYVYNLMMHSNEESGEEITFRFYNTEENQWYEFSETLLFEPDMIEADAYDPFELKNGTVLKADWINNIEFSFEVYPNPFNGILNISFNNQKNQRVNISVYDGFGRKVGKIKDKTYQAGRFNVEWNDEGLPNGIYFIRMETNSYIGNQKVIKVN